MIELQTLGVLGLKAADGRPVHSILSPPMPSGVTISTSMAARAYRHYLALRIDPEPALRPEVDAVRKDLARLVP